jgi:hypothetical protein
MCMFQNGADYSVSCAHDNCGCGARGEAESAAQPRATGYGLRLTVFLRWRGLGRWLARPDFGADFGADLRAGAEYEVGTKV